MSGFSNHSPHIPRHKTRPLGVDSSLVIFEGSMAGHIAIRWVIWASLWSFLRFVSFSFFFLAVAGQPLGTCEFFLRFYRFIFFCTDIWFIYIQKVVSADSFLLFLFILAFPSLGSLLHFLSYSVILIIEDSFSLLPLFFLAKHPFF